MCSEKELRKGLIQKFGLLDGFIEERNGKTYAIIPIEDKHLKNGSRIRGTLKIESAVIPTHNEIIIDVLQGAIDYGYIQINTPYQLDKNGHTCFPPDYHDFELWIDGKRHFKHVAAGKIAMGTFYKDNPNIRTGSKLKITIDRLWKKYVLSHIN